MPPLVGGMIAFYYRSIPLSWKMFVAVILSCGSLFVRWFVTGFAVHFIFPEDFVALDWPVRHYFFFASLLGPCAAVIPLHFFILFNERRRLERKLKGR
jgi:NhaP-type Na+/H+ or K+/H+ antiporter